MPQIATRATCDRLGPGNYGRISRIAGLSKQHVSRVLKGQRNATLEVAALIAAAADVSLDQLYRFVVGLPTNVPGRPTQRQLRAALDPTLPRTRQPKRLRKFKVKPSRALAVRRSITALPPRPPSKASLKPLSPKPDLSEAATTPEDALARVRSLIVRRTRGI